MQKSRLAALSVVSTALLFVFAAAATRLSFDFGAEKGLYGELAASFARGNAHLLREPPPELLKLRDPYQYGLAWKYKIWDLSMYNGKYYLYFGPMPALARLALFNAPTQAAMLSLYLWIFAVFLILFLMLVKDEFAPQLPDSIVFLLGFIAAVNPITLFMAIQPSVYTEAIAAGSAFAMAALYFFARAELAGGSPASMLAAGALIATAFAARFSHIATAAIMCAFLAAARGPRNPRSLAAFITPVLLGGALLLAYNYARFDNIFEFGVSYQYNATRKYVAAGKFFSASYILPHLNDYLLRLPRFSLKLPFVTGTGPAGLVADSNVFTMFLLCPAALLALLIPLRRAASPTGSEKIYLLFVSCGLAVLILTSANVANSLRYMQDFTPFFACAGAAAFLCRFSGWKAGRTVLLLLVLLNAYIGFGMALSALQDVDQRQYLAIAEFLL